MFGIIAGMRGAVLERNKRNGFRTVGVGATERILRSVFGLWPVITVDSPSFEADLFGGMGLGVRLFSNRAVRGGYRFYCDEPGSYFGTGNFIYICLEKIRRDGDSCGRACTIPACNNQSENMVLAEQIKEAIRRQDTLGEVSLTSTSEE